ncbi:hypothetical protein HMPREF0490_00253 [Lachnospiraceae bacterium 6_1_37FAA]|nr:hypothetical protein HMPREF0490_00253 [Lachnospiraceae bacterium 6_1_37FAA]
MKMRKRKWGKAGIILISVCCWCLSLLLLNKIEQRAGCFNGYFSSPAVTCEEVRRFQEQSQNPEILPEITAWSKEEGQQIRGEIRESVTEDVWKLSGNMEHFFVGSLAGGSYPWEKDEEGCMVSTALAEELFGTQMIEGMQVEIAGKEYWIRGCIKSGEAFAAVHAEKGDVMQGIFLSYQDRSVSGSLAKNLLGQIVGREPDGFWEGNLYSAAARVIVTIPAWVLAAICMSGVWSLTGRITDFRLRLIIKLTAAAGICVLTAVGLCLTFRFSPDYLPVMWSDLEFFPSLIEKKWGEFQNVCQFALCPGDAGMLGNFRNIMFVVAGSLLASINISADIKAVLIQKCQNCLEPDNPSEECKDRYSDVDCTRCIHHRAD